MMWWSQKAHSALSSSRDHRSLSSVPMALYKATIRASLPRISADRAAIIDSPCRSESDRSSKAASSCGSALTRGVCSQPLCNTISPCRTWRNVSSTVTCAVKHVVRAVAWSLLLCSVRLADAQLSGLRNPTSSSLRIIVAELPMTRCSTHSVAALS